MITYNHQQYVSTAIQSVIDQKCAFPVVLHIADDESIDRTAEICLEYSQKYPSIIRFVQRAQNIGMAANAIQTLAECLEYEPKYIALLEGDDYWTDSCKLQKQVDAMDAFENASLVFTDARKLINGMPQNYFSQKKPPEKFNLEYFLDGNIRIPTCTVLLKYNVAKEIVRIYPRNEVLFHIDYLMWCVAGKLGEFLFVDTATGMYRVHGSSAVRSTSHQNTLSRGMKMNQFLAKYFGPPYDRHFSANNWWYFLEYSFMELRNRNYFKSLSWFIRSLSDSMRHGHRNQLQITRDYIYRFRHNKQARS
jgi:glycosyltransferase involved in cell wall biosynthesis